MTEKKVGTLNEAQVREIMDHIESPGSDAPETVKEAKTIELGRIFELADEYLVVMPPNLALCMPKVEDAGLEEVRHQVISMVAYHTKVIEK
jgi:hypothetical protein